MTHTLKYDAEPTFVEFHASKARRRGVRGPIGSGKSTACSIEIFRRASEQAPSQDKKRKTRFAIIRNTYRQLHDTTLKTWLDWFPETAFGKFNYSMMEHRIKFGDIESEVLFRALDRPEHVANLLSLELTGAWVNEARELPFGVIQALDDRIGRFPAVKDGGATWVGVIMDTNSPDTDHWWYRMAEEDRPEGWSFFTQPSGVDEVGGKFLPNKSAENLKNLEKDFYKIRIQGKNKDHIRVYYCNRYGFVKDGKPVYPEYIDEVHCAKQPILVDRKAPLYVGVDFGLTPAALFAQPNVSGRWFWIDELVTEDMGAMKFGELLAAKLRREYAGMDIQVFGDPAGAQRAQTDETTPFMILQAKEIPIVSAPSNDPILRHDAVAKLMGRMIDGLPGFQVSPRCKMARKGLAGGYCLRRIQVIGAERYKDTPEKNRYSHVVEAGEYAMLGAGEGATVIGMEDDDDDWDDYDLYGGRSAVTGY